MESLANVPPTLKSKQPTHTGTPGNNTLFCFRAMRTAVPALFKEEPDLLLKLVTMISPTLLKANGVEVFKTVQNAGEIIITFPKAYHAGFSHGIARIHAALYTPAYFLTHRTRKQTCRFQLCGSCEFCNRR